MLHAASKKNFDVLFIKTTTLNRNRICLWGSRSRQNMRSLVLETPIVVHKIQSFEVDCAGMTPTQFHGVVLHFSPALSTSVVVAFALDRYRRLSSSTAQEPSAAHSNQTSKTQVDRVVFSVMDDAIVDFCAQEDRPSARRKRICMIEF